MRFSTIPRIVVAGVKRAVALKIIVTLIEMSRARKTKSK